MKSGATHGVPANGSAYLLIHDSRSEDRVQRIVFRDGVFRFFGFNQHEGQGEEITISRDAASTIVRFILHWLR